MNEKDDFALQDFLPYLLNRAAEESSLGFQKHYKNRYGMLRTEWRVLFHLGNYGEMTAKEIGSRAKIHKTKISRTQQQWPGTDNAQAAAVTKHGDSNCKLLLQPVQTQRNGNFSAHCSTLDDRRQHRRIYIR